MGLNGIFSFSGGMQPLQPGAFSPGGAASAANSLNLDGRLRFVNSLTSPHDITASTGFSWMPPQGAHAPSLAAPAGMDPAQFMSGDTRSVFNMTNGAVSNANAIYKSTMAGLGNPAGASIAAPGGSMASAPGMGGGLNPAQFMSGDTLNVLNMTNSALGNASAIYKSTMAELGNPAGASGAPVSAPVGFSGGAPSPGGGLNPAQFMSGDTLNVLNLTNGTLGNADRIHDETQAWLAKQPSAGASGEQGGDEAAS